MSPDISEQELNLFFKPLDDLLGGRSLVAPLIQEENMACRGLAAAGHFEELTGWLSQFVISKFGELHADMVSFELLTQKVIHVPAPESQLSFWLKFDQPTFPRPNHFRVRGKARVQMDKLTCAQVTFLATAKFAYLNRPPGRLN